MTKSNKSTKGGTSNTHSSSAAHDTSQGTSFENDCTAKPLMPVFGRWPNITETDLALGPAQLFAHIPGALGFFPRESLILMGFSMDQDGLALGPLARLDLANVQSQLDEAFDAVASGSSLVLGFVVTNRFAASANELADFLFNFSSHDDCGIDALWRCTEITTGQDFDMWFGPEELGDMPVHGWLNGKIDNITEAKSMMQWIERGELPELNRHEVFKRYQIENETISAGQRSHMQQLATAAGSELRDCVLGRNSNKQYGSATSIADSKKNTCAHWAYRMHALFLHDVTRLLGEVGEFGEILKDRDLLLTAALWMSTTTTRDAAVKPLLEQPDAASNLLLAIVQTFEGEIKANALALFAACQIAQDRGVIGGQALNYAVEHYPEHTLCVLLNRAYRAGLHDKLIGNMMKGSSLARRKWAASLRKRHFCGQCGMPVTDIVEETKPQLMNEHAA